MKKLIEAIDFEIRQLAITDSTIIITAADLYNMWIRIQTKISEDD